MKISRTWAMPNGKTFIIKPIRELVERYIVGARVIVDPFANGSKIGTITNDLNPKYETNFHLDALEFLRLQDAGIADVVLYDPPYSITQAKRLYDEYGKEKLSVSVSNMSYWSKCKNEVARIVKPNGFVIMCGWNTNGLGKGRGFSMIEVLMVSHGGSKNDTLVTVETPCTDGKNDNPA